MTSCVCAGIAGFGLELLCCTSAFAELTGHKEAFTASSEDTRGLLEDISRRELGSFDASDCSVEAFDVPDVSCGGSYPVPACCTGSNPLELTCGTDDSGVGGSCPSSSYLGCCPRST